MDTTNAVVPTVTLTTLSRALKENNNKLVLQKLSTLTVEKILEARDMWFNVHQELLSKRRNLEEIEGEPTRKGRKELIKHFKEDVEKLERQLAKTMYLPMLIELYRKEEDEIMNVIQLMVIDVIKYYHTTEKMNEAQIHETAFRIIDTYKGLTLEDVALCFHRAKSGAYGAIYNRIDGPVILNWLSKYKDGMQATGMDRELSKHLQGKGNTYKDGGEYRITDIKKINQYFR